MSAALGRSGDLAAQFAPLFKPLTLGGIRLPNRVVMSAMGTRFAAVDGDLSPRHASYYHERAAGGVGTIIVEATSVHPQGTTYARKPRLYDDRYVEHLARIADAIHAGGAVAGVQLL